MNRRSRYQYPDEDPARGEESQSSAVVPVRATRGAASSPIAQGIVMVSEGGKVAYDAFDGMPMKRGRVALPEEEGAFALAERDSPAYNEFEQVLKRGRASKKIDDEAAYAYRLRVTKKRMRERWLDARVFCARRWSSLKRGLSRLSELLLRSREGKGLSKHDFVKTPESSAKRALWNACCLLVALALVAFLLTLDGLHCSFGPEPCRPADMGSLRLDVMPWEPSFSGVASRNALPHEMRGEAIEPSSLAPGRWRHPKAEPIGTLRELEGSMKRFLSMDKSVACTCAREWGFLVRAWVFRSPDKDASGNDAFYAGYNCEVSPGPSDRKSEVLFFNHAMYPDRPPWSRTVLDAVSIECDADSPQGFVKRMDVEDESAAWCLQLCYDLDKGISLYDRS